MIYYDIEIYPLKKHNWVATDHDGQVWAFENKPIIKRDFWYNPEGYSTGEDRRGSRVPGIEWRDSLCLI